MVSIITQYIPYAVTKAKHLFVSFNHGGILIGKDIIGIL